MRPTNSFVIIFPNNEDAETVYWLAYSLWKSNYWHQSLYGSEIPFMRIQDFKKDFDLKVNEMLDDFELHQKTSLGVEVAGTKRRAIASKYNTYKRYAKGDFVSV